MTAPLIPKKYFPILSKVLWSASSGLRTSETDEIYAYLPGSGHRLHCQPDGQKIPNQLPYLTFKACPPKASTMYSLAAITRKSLSIPLPNPKRC